MHLTLVATAQKSSNPLGTQRVACTRRSTREDCLWSSHESPVVRGIACFRKAGSPSPLPSPLGRGSAFVGHFARGLAVALMAASTWGASLPLSPSLPNEIAFAPQSAKFVRLVLRHSQGEPCIDELEVYGPDGGSQPGARQQRRQGQRVVAPAGLRHPPDRPSQRRALRQQPQLDRGRRAQRVGADRTARAARRLQDGVLAGPRGAVR